MATFTDVDVSRYAGEARTAWKLIEHATAQEAALSELVSHPELVTTNGVLMLPDGDIGEGASNEASIWDFLRDYIENLPGVVE